MVDSVEVAHAGILPTGVLPNTLRCQDYDDHVWQRMLEALEEEISYIPHLLTSDEVTLRARLLSEHLPLGRTCHYAGRFCEALVNRSFQQLSTVDSLAILNEFLYLSGCYSQVALILEWVFDFDELTDLMDLNEAVLEALIAVDAPAMEIERALNLAISVKSKYSHNRNTVPEYKELQQIVQSIQPGHQWSESVGV